MKNQAQQSTATMKIKKKIVIIGMGPAGLLTALDLIQRPNHDIVIIEKRSDPRIVALANPQTLRSYPIALNSRGITSLNKIPGLKESTEKEGIYLSGVCLHSTSTKKYKPPRIIERDTPSLSIDRNRLTLNLLEQLVQRKAVDSTTISIQFDTSLTEINLDQNYIHVVQNMNDINKEFSSKLTFDHLVAADGSNSLIRRHLAQQQLLKSTEKVIPDEYKTIFLSRRSEDRTVRLDDDKLHGWMIGQNQSIRIVTAPVIENLVSGAFVFNRGHNPFAKMTSSEEIQNWFQHVCPTTLAKLITEKEAAELLSRPVSTLLSVRCNRLNVNNQVILLGDAAHAMSASVGQGCNAALQDVYVFSELLDKHNNDWNFALQAYTEERIEDIHAVSDLSDYSTPRTKWMKIEWFIRIMLRKILPSWLSTRLLIPLPMDLLQDTDMPYREVLSQTKWWIDRVKSSFPRDEKALA